MVFSAFTQKLNQFSKQLKDTRQLFFKKMKIKLQEEMHVVWEKRQFADVWALARRLSWRGIGPKKRAYRVPVKEKPLEQDWIDHLARKGADGGNESKTIDFDQVE